MEKLIFWLLVGYIVYTVYGRRHKEPDHPRRIAEPEDMVRCAQCGVHLPRSEGILSRGEFFCCDAHRKLHQ
ncbi:MAG: PP0621 family protein [Betaproteobacteria bacterium]|nr:PP0621 family protein [Betaproteobacteria bacterium]